MEVLVEVLVQEKREEVEKKEEKIETEKEIGRERENERERERERERDRDKGKHPNRQRGLEKNDMALTLKALNLYALHWHSRMNVQEMEEAKEEKRALTLNALGHYGPGAPPKDKFNAIGMRIHCKLCGIKDDHRRSACSFLCVDADKDLCPVATLSYERM